MDSISDLTGIPWQGIGLGGLVTMAVFFLFTGRLVTKNAYDKMEASKDKEIDRWIQVAQRAEDLADRQSIQISELIEGGRTTTRVVDALQQTVLESRGQ